MRVLSLSLDPGILNPESVVARRSVGYGEKLTAYTVLVPARETSTAKLSDRVTVYGLAGTKLQQWWRMYQKARALLRENSYDVVSSQDTYFLGLLGYILARQFHLGFEAQGLGIEKLSLGRKRLALFVLHRASVVRVLSRVLWKRLVAEFGLSEEKMRLVPIYVDTSSFGFLPENQTEALTRQLQTEVANWQERYHGRCNIISVNRLVPVKNIGLQLAAIKELKADFPELLLHIIGEGPERPHLERQIEALDLKGHVILEGQQGGATLSAFFTQADIFVLTSLSEGWGMAVIEAATASRPIVMTDVGCAHEVIVDQESGLVIPTNDLDALVDALKKLLGDPELRKRLSKGAYQATQALPTFAEVVEQYRATWEVAAVNRL